MEQQQQKRGEKYITNLSASSKANHTNNYIKHEWIKTLYLKGRDCHTGRKQDPLYTIYKRHIFNRKTQMYWK